MYIHIHIYTCIYIYTSRCIYTAWSFGGFESPAKHTRGNQLRNVIISHLLWGSVEFVGCPDLFERYMIVMSCDSF